mmetsp:Transcript_16104/g.20431  ORF Transcript_16104/g.20431 Transcript_16104/m.20431 type:complete len:250 (+) Transcript_16104:127-876(+)
MLSLRYAMVQSINTKAILTLASVVRRPYLASPHIHVDTISEVNYQSMRDFCGIKAVIFDKDNTLTAPYDVTIHEKAALGLSRALDVFGHDNVAILSNSAGTKDDQDYEDAIKIEKELGINVIRHDEKKPGGLDEVLDHFKGQGVEDASELCMVGDRLLTDVVFGNLYGMLTVHCLPLCSGEDNAKDNKVASIVRTVENNVMYKDWWFGKMVRKRTIPHKVWLGHDACPLVFDTGEEISREDSPLQDKNE